MGELDSGPDAPVADPVTLMCRAAAEQGVTLLRGQAPPRLVDPEAWPFYSERFERIIGVRPDPLPPGA